MKFLRLLSSLSSADVLGNYVNMLRPWILIIGLAVFTAVGVQTASAEGVARIILNVAENVIDSGKSFYLKPYCLNGNDKLDTSAKVYYTLDGTLPTEESETVPAEGILVKCAEPYGRVTVNMLAMNDGGSIVASACYEFYNGYDCVYRRVDDPASLHDGDRVLFVRSYSREGFEPWIVMQHGFASGYDYTNMCFQSVDLKINDDGTIIDVPVEAMALTLEKSGSTWRFKTPEGDYLTAKSNATPFVISKTSSSLSNFKFETVGSSYRLKTNSSNRYICATAQNAADRVAEWKTKTSLSGNDECPVLYVKEAGKEFVHTPADADNEFYLVIEDLETGNQLTQRFTNLHNGKHQLSVANFSGRFYIRDGRADNSGTFFGAHAEDTSAANYSAGNTRADTSAESDICIDRQDKRYTLERNPATLQYFTTSSDVAAGMTGGLYSGTLTLDTTGDGPTLALTDPVVTGATTLLSPDSEKGPATYFDLQGRPVSNPTVPGLYIRRTPVSSTLFRLP